MGDTPRTDDLRNARLVHAVNHPTLGLEGEDLIRAQLDRLIDEPPSFLQFARQLERELGAATAELAAAKEQLRVARETLSEALDLDEMDDIRESHAHQILLNLFVRLNNFTQPNLSADSPGGGNPVKGEGGVPSTFPA